MRYSLFTAVVAAASVSAAPSLIKRADYEAPTGGDVTILNYALTLEYLERAFYREGLKNFTNADFVAAGFPDPFYANLKEIAYDEEVCPLSILSRSAHLSRSQVHVDYLSTALKAVPATPVTEGTYKFGVTSARNFVTLASVLEGVGVSAYLGAAQAIVNSTFKTHDI
jgi:hypothetical protein